VIDLGRGTGKGTRPGTETPGESFAWTLTLEGSGGGDSPAGPRFLKQGLDAFIQDRP
jgi:hypothetical protein